MNDNRAFIPSKKECLKILKKYHTPINVIEHCIVTTKIAEEIIADITSVEKELIVAGAMLHDIGRSEDHSILHAIKGVEILKQENIDSRIISIVENHIGTGIIKEEAVKLGLPVKDYIPKTPEEIIVSYSDNLACGLRKCTFDQTVKKFIEKFGENSHVVKGFYKQKEFIMKLKNKDE